MMRNPQPNWASSLNVTNMGLGNHCDSYPPPSPKQPKTKKHTQNNITYTSKMQKEKQKQTAELHKC
jgi:hypothetical protein